MYDAGLLVVDGLVETEAVVDAVGNQGHVASGRPTKTVLAGIVAEQPDQQTEHQSEQQQHQQQQQQQQEQGHTSDNPLHLVGVRRDVCDGLS